MLGDISCCWLVVHLFGVHTRWNYYRVGVRDLLDRNTIGKNKAKKKNVHHGKMAICKLNDGFPYPQPPLLCVLAKCTRNVEWNGTAPPRLFEMSLSDSPTNNKMINMNVTWISILIFFLSQTIHCQCSTAMHYWCLYLPLYNGHLSSCIIYRKFIEFLLLYCSRIFRLSTKFLQCSAFLLCLTLSP